MSGQRRQSNDAVDGKQPLLKICYLKDIKANNTNGGDFTSGAYRTRVLNTHEGDTSFCSLNISTNQFTLQAGTYEITAWCPAYDVDNNKAKIQNITDGTVAILGQSSLATNDSVAGQEQFNSMVIGMITITSSKVFELQHRCTLTQVDTGFGFPTNYGDNEVYAVMKIVKVG